MHCGNMYKEIISEKLLYLLTKITYCDPFSCYGLEDNWHFSLRQFTTVYVKTLQHDFLYACSMYKTIKISMRTQANSFTRRRYLDVFCTPISIHLLFYYL